MKKSHANAITRAASSWVVRQERGLSEPEQTALALWLEADPRHRGAYTRAQAAWHLTTRTSEPAAMSPTNGISRRSLWLGAGSAAAACLAGGLWWTLDSGVDYDTGLGEVRRVALRDGSSLLINTLSHVSVHYSSRKRTVRLTEGEVWFDIARDANRPFEVRSGEVRITAIGTAFRVHRLMQASEIIVTEGLVEIVRGGDRLTLGAGQRLVADKGPLKPTPISPGEYERRLAWRQGLIILNGETLSEAVTEFNRHSARTLVITDPALRGERVVGRFRANDAEGFARATALILSVPVQIGPDEISLGG